jgi:hypothetical protein
MLDTLRELLNLSKKLDPEVEVERREDAIKIKIEISVRDYIGDVNLLCKSIIGIFRKETKDAKPRDLTGALPGRVRRRNGPRTECGRE